MRFIGHIKKGDVLISRASVDDVEGESASETAAKGMARMMADMERHRDDIKDPKTAQNKADRANFNRLNIIYGAVIEKALETREGMMFTGLVDGKREIIRANIMEFSDVGNGMTCYFEAKTDQWIEETENSLSKLLA